MDASKQQYLNSIRGNTAYPTYRGFIGMITMLGYLLAGAAALGAVIGALTMMTQSFMLGLVTLVIGAVWAAVIYFVAQYFREAALVLVDMADSITDANSRQASV